MENNSVSPLPDMAPIAEFDKTPPTPPEEQTLPMDDLPPPPTTVTVADEKQEEDLAQYCKMFSKETRKSNLSQRV
ncbi:hypothetical protein Trydic_g12220 [Trypoxylus dichotomus]